MQSKGCVWLLLGRSAGNMQSNGCIWSMRMSTKGRRIDSGGSESGESLVVSDRIERSVEIVAAREEVWRVLADAKEFGEWFGVKIKGEFRPGERVSGQVTHKGYEHVVWSILVVRMERERVFSFRWNPYAVEPDVDYSKEEPTLVEFTLEDCTLQDGAGGTKLTVVESGFDKVPLERRALAYRMNSGGWDYQVEAIRKYVTKACA